jgi:hypothetical protein
VPVEAEHPAAAAQGQAPAEETGRAQGQPNPLEPQGRAGRRPREAHRPQAQARSTVRREAAARGRPAPGELQAAAAVVVAEEEEEDDDQPKKSETDEATIIGR